jgi:hypothetical protein
MIQTLTRALLSPHLHHRHDPAFPAIYLVLASG